MSEEEDFDPQFEFFECCRYGDEEVGTTLLAEYPEIDPCKPDEFGTTPLHAAAANGLVQLLNEIIRVKGDKLNLNVQTGFGSTPLHYASLNRNSKIIEILIKAGADPKIKDSQGRSPLFEAVSKFNENDPNELKAVDLLVGPDSDIPEGIQVKDEDDDDETEEKNK